MQVTPVGSEHRAPVEDSPTYNDEARIENRHTQDQKRNRQTYERGGFSLAYQTSGSNHKTDKHRTAIAHENLGGVEIKDQKACYTTQKSQH